MKKKIVYVGIASDILHNGHMNLLKFASKFGVIYVGPILSYFRSTIIFAIYNFNKKN